MISQDLVVSKNIFYNLINEDCDSLDSLNCFSFLSNILNCCRSKIIKNKFIEKEYREFNELVRKTEFRTIYYKWYKEMLKRGKFIIKEIDKEFSPEIPKAHIKYFQTLINSNNKIYVVEDEELHKIKDTVIKDYGIKILDIKEAIDNVISFQYQYDWKSIIENGENQKVEFKSSLRWDYHQDKLNRALAEVVAKEICGFLNSNGGILFIGIDDNGNTLGLENDYKTLSKKNRDGFLLALDNVIANNLGNEVFCLLEIEICNIDSYEICVIKVEKSNEARYFKDCEFYIRRASSVKQLNPKETIDYIKERNIEEK